MGLFRNVAESYRLWRENQALTREIELLKEENRIRTAYLARVETLQAERRRWKNERKRQRNKGR